MTARKASPEERVKLAAKLNQAEGGAARAPAKGKGDDKLAKARQAAKARTAKKPVKATVRRS